MGFSAEWLALREPADRAARDRDLARRVCAAQPAAPVVVDLGAGTGATRRALDGLLPSSTEWILVDNERALLDAAARAGDEADRIVVADLNDIPALPLERATLVTASALLDLVSHDWLAALVARLRALCLPLYATLSYDGCMAWMPPADSDEHVVAAFNRHQRGDKGFGPALGPDAADTAAKLFTAADFRVHRASSPWWLGAGQVVLQRNLIGSVATAASEAGSEIAAPWLTARLALSSYSTCRIGHTDLLALPPPGCDKRAGCAIVDEGPAGRPQGADDA